MPRKARKTAVILNFPIQDRDVYACSTNYECYWAAKITAIQALNEFTLGIAIPSMRHISGLRSFNTTSRECGLPPLEYDFGKWCVVGRVFIIFGV